MSSLNTPLNVPMHSDGQVAASHQIFELKSKSIRYDLESENLGDGTFPSRISERYATL